MSPTKYIDHCWSAIVMLVMAGHAQADLIDRGGGLIYDTDLDITWIADTNHAATELSDTRVAEIIAAVGSVASHALTPNDFLKDPASGNYTGQMSWWGAIAWADQLVYTNPVTGAIYNDWRLPTTPVSDSSCTNLSGAPQTGSVGYNCTGSELGHMFYIELSGSASLTAASLLTSGDPDLAKLSNLKIDYYHSSFEILPCLNLPTSDCSAYFSYYSGFQWETEKYKHKYGWAVRQGDVIAPLNINQSTLPNAFVNTSYGTQLTATGGDGQYSWTLDAGALPPGLALNTNGQISGTPQSATGSPYSFTVLLTDGTGASTTKTFVITVKKVISCYSCHASPYT